MPTKTIRGRSNAPWFTQEHKRLCRKKERCFIQAKKKGGEHWNKYHQIKREVERKLRKAERNHVADIADSDDPKLIWKYVKTKRKDNVGISTLKVDGCTISDDQSKARTLAKQFNSVFNIDSGVLPAILPSPYPTMPDVVVDQDGVLKLLKDINVKKAIGPDSIPNKALKLAAEELAPVITSIFQVFNNP